MQGKFICHRDFAALRPLDVFHKEMEERSLPDVGEKYRNRHILFRRKFRLDTCGTAFIDITADDYFKLYINGTFVMQGPPPSYPNAYGYMRADVGRFCGAEKTSLPSIPITRDLSTACGFRAICARVFSANSRWTVCPCWSATNNESAPTIRLIPTAAESDTIRHLRSGTTAVPGKSVLNVPIMTIRRGKTRKFTKMPITAR